MLLALFEDYFELSCVTIEKFLSFWFMQQRTLSYVISVLVVFSVGERLLALRMPYSTFRWIFMEFKCF